MGTCNPPGNTPPEEHIVVLGIGNVLWADEGFGVRCIEALQREWTFAPHVELIDGGTQGLYLIQNVQSATRLLIFDAIDYGLAPGTLKLIENDEVPKFMGASQVLLIGCQPEELEDYGGSLRPIVRQAMSPALAHGLEALTAWGAQPQRRAKPLPEDATLTGAMLTLERYESERPSAEHACRKGDDRFIPKGL